MRFAANLKQSSQQGHLYCRARNKACMSLTWYFAPLPPFLISLLLPTAPVPESSWREDVELLEEHLPITDCGTAPSGSRGAHIQIHLDRFTCANPHFFQHFPTNRRQRDQQTERSIIFPNYYPVKFAVVWASRDLSSSSSGLKCTIQR